MTLEEEYDKEFPVTITDSVIARKWLVEARNKEKNWFKSYLKEFLESVKLEKFDKTDLEYESDRGYWNGWNEALSDQSAKIAEELKKRGL